MGLLNPVEQRSPRGRLFRAAVVLVLGLGAVTMIYPFLLMLATSVTSDVDYKDYRLIPRYLTDDTVLFRKFLFERYGPKEIGQVAAKYRLGLVAIDGQPRPVESYDDLSFDPNALAAQDRSGGRLLADWSAFIAQLPKTFTRLYYLSLFIDGPTQVEFQDFLAERFAGRIDAFNAFVQAVLPYPDFRSIDVPENTPNWHHWFPEQSPLKRLCDEYVQHLPPARINPVCMDQPYQIFLRLLYKTLDRLNAAWGTRYQTFSQIGLPVRLPDEPSRQESWARFVRLEFPWYYTRASGDYTAAWRAFLARKYGSEKLYNELVDRINGQSGRRAVPYLAETVFPPGPPDNEFLFKHWGEFLDAEVPAQAKTLLTVESQWRRFLQDRYPSLEAVNRAHGTAAASWDDLFPPYLAMDVHEFHQTRSAWKRYFLTHNFQRVLEFITTKGYALYNTVVLVVLTVVGVLVVQSVAAYALSRYNLSYSHQIILFLLATMAFPAEVGMIPSFLLMRELGLLNTFAALVLPGLCSGIGILWLKGYFDSLPKELYDAALIDGASEMQTLWHIVLPMAKPVLAVVALGSFTAAYTGFMWAFVTCQDPKMWTLMVWLYEFQKRASVPTQMAAFVIAALPTLLVFVLCQKVIMRGIVVPTMK